VPLRYEPFRSDPRTRWTWLVAIVVAGLAAWFLDASPAPGETAEDDDPSPGEAAGGPELGPGPAPGDVAEVDIIWNAEEAPSGPAADGDGDGE